LEGFAHVTFVVAALARRRAGGREGVASSEPDMLAP